MAGFKQLKELCLQFDEDLKTRSEALFCASVGDDVENIVTKKIKELTLLSAKYRLLRAKELTSLPQTAEHVENSTDIIQDYEDTAQLCLLERMVSKSVSRNRALQQLLTTPNRRLSEDMVERKAKISARLNKIRTLDSELRYLDSLLTEKQREHEKLRKEWDTTLGEYKDLTENRTGDVQHSDSPLYSKLKCINAKVDLMRQLIPMLGTGRTQYDWLSDPKDVLQAFATARHVYQ